MKKSNSYALIACLLVFQSCSWLLVLSPVALALYQVDSPPLLMDHDYYFTIRLKDSGKVLALQTTRLSKDNSTITDATFARRSDNGTARNIQTLTRYVLNNNKLTVLFQQATVYKEGKTCQTRQFNFNWDNYKASLEMRDNIKNTVNTKNIKLTAKTVLAGASNYYFQNLISRNIQQDKFTMLTNDGDIYNMSVNISYVPQTIALQGKNIACFRVDMKADLGLFSIVAPNMAFYFNAKPPYDFVRYEGLESGPNSPNIIEEMVDALPA